MDSSFRPNDGNPVIAGFFQQPHMRPYSSFHLDLFPLLTTLLKRDALAGGFHDEV